MGAGRPGPPARPGGGGGPRPGAVGAWRGGPAGGPRLTGGGCRRGSFGRGDGGASDILELWKNTKIVKGQNLELYFVFWRKKSRAILNWFLFLGWLEEAHLDVAMGVPQIY